MQKAKELDLYGFEHTKRQTSVQKPTSFIIYISSQIHQKNLKKGLFQ